MASNRFWKGVFRLLFHDKIVSNQGFPLNFNILMQTIEWINWVWIVITISSNLFSWCLTVEIMTILLLYCCSYCFYLPIPYQSMLESRINLDAFDLSNVKGIKATMKSKTFWIWRILFGRNPQIFRWLMGFVFALGEISW